MPKNVHVIAHMHWDREWYFTTEESRILLVNNMEEILDRLENDPNYPYYLLDGQTAILEDYFDVKPENKNRVKKLVQQGKLLIGPWYTQTDEMVVGGESIVRNLLYGIKDSKQFGQPMLIGYLPDSFGQSEKMPQILNGFGITRSVFWRGSSERHGTNKHNFYWAGHHGGEVLVHLLPLGYAIGKYLPLDLIGLKKRMDKYLPVLDKGSVTENEDIVLPNGHDQMPIQQNIFDVLKNLKELYPDRNFFLSKYENVFEELEKTENLDTIFGELLDGKYMRVHRSIFSSRADLKSMNTRIENKITNILEPLASIAHKLGFSYEHGLIESIWKYILKNHAHDSIGCCCSDKVHSQIASRFFLAEDKTDELIKYYKRKISDAIPQDVAIDKLVVFNLLPYPRREVIDAEIITKMKNFELVDEEGEIYPFNLAKKEIIDAGLIDRQIVHYGDYDPFVKYYINFSDSVPAMGYKTFLVKEIPGQIQIKKDIELNFAENKYFKITINSNGSFNIVDKLADICYAETLLIEDGSDDGDEYDFSELEDDFVISSKNCLTSDSNITQLGLKTILSSKFTMSIPKDLESRKAKICDSEMNIEIIATMYQDSKIIKLDVQVENNSLDHRVRLILPQQITATASVSDNQFGCIKRPVVDSAINVWQAENWDERPDPIYPMLCYVSTDSSNGLSILTNSVREFEIIGENFDKLAITLFRSVGCLGKEDLYRRPGRPSGIKMLTPDSQLLGKQKFQLAVTPNDSNIATLAKEYLTPLVYYNKMPYNAMKLNDVAFTLPYQFSMFNIPESGFVMSVLKKAELLNGYIFRAYQCSADQVMLTGLYLENEVNLNEEIINQQETNENDINQQKIHKTIVLDNNIVKSYLIKI
ncbi:MAG: alpha-mannosidase [Candidatus Epulonipiscioides saccharophilum]|nr:MAG: alpha-mannosidase [Epulopiscium sp. AS2M-Bin001]